MTPRHSTTDSGVDSVSRESASSGRGQKRASSSPRRELKKGEGRLASSAQRRRFDQGWGSFIASYKDL